MDREKLSKIAQNDTIVTGVYCRNDGGKIPVKGIKVFSANFAALISECYFCGIIYVYVKSKNIDSEFIEKVEKFNNGEISLAGKYEIIHGQSFPGLDEG